MEDAHDVILAILRIALGFLICITGYRFFRVSLAIVTLLEGGYFFGTVVNVLVYGWVDDPWEYWVAFYTGGLVCSLVAVLYPKSGICVTGFCGGMELAKMIFNVVNYLGSYEVRLVVMAVAGLVSAILTYKLKKPALLVVMSFVGANVLVNGVNYFVWKAILASHAEDDIDGILSADRASWWTLWVICLGLFVAGTLFQFTVTSKGVHHEAKDELSDEKKSTRATGIAVAQV